MVVLPLSPIELGVCDPEVNATCCSGPTHGHQEGTAYNGHFECTCYHPLLFCFNQFGDLERALLREGQVHSADDWRSVLEPVVSRYRGTKRRFFRGDAAFAKPEIYEFLEQEGYQYAIRRKVIGQMLDYAANAVAYWPVEEIRAKFKSRCEKNDEDPDDVLTSFLGEDQDIDDFWQQVKTNLQAGRIRMVFLADSIPAELRRVVEFLNEQMDPAEVLAIEVKQFVGEGMKTLVPRVLGARQKKSSGGKSGKKWDEESFMKALRDGKSEKAQTTAKELLDWITPQVTYLDWGRGSMHGGIVAVIKYDKTKYNVCRMATQGLFVFRFDWLCKNPPFKDEAVRKELLAKINDIPGVSFDDNVLTKAARIPFETLGNSLAMEKLKSTVVWQIEQIKVESEKESG